VHDAQVARGTTPEIHRVIETAGRGAYYVFDCLSELATDWYSDLEVAKAMDAHGLV
jgi:hypothetical protein